MKLAHVVLRTTGLSGMVDWWQDALGANVVYENASMAFLTFDEEHHRLAIVQPPGLGGAVPKTVGMDHVAFSMNDLDDLMSHYEQLLARGIAPFWAVNHGPTVSMYYKDPDGNKAEFQVERFDSPALATQFMNSPAFRGNPIGITLDPADFAARYRAGEPSLSLLAYKP